MTQQSRKNKIVGEVQVFSPRATNAIYTLEELEQVLDKAFSSSLDFTIQTESAGLIFMDADRQRLELDITKEFEFADGEATELIDEAE